MYDCRLVKGPANKVNNVVKNTVNTIPQLQDWWWI